MREGKNLWLVDTSVFTGYFVLGRSREKVSINIFTVKGFLILSEVP